MARAMSDELKADVYPLLSDAQRAEILRGGRVSIGVAQLPPRVRAKVRTYAEFCERGTEGLLPSRINWARWSEFQARFSTDPLVGVGVTLDDGRLAVF